MTPHSDQPPAIQRLALLSLVTSLAALALIIVVAGYQLLAGHWAEHVAVAFWILASLVSATYQSLVVAKAARQMAALRSYAADFALLGLIAGASVTGQWNLLAILVFVRQGLLVVRVVLATPRGRQWLVALVARPAKLLAASFLLVIVLGTLFLTFPRATTDGAGAPLVDAAFTATSATCVTGLAVLNTNNDTLANPSLQSFSTFGQLVILVLIQVGGLGIMTISAAVVLLLGRSLGMRSQALMQQVMEESSRRDLENSIRFILKMTIFTELAGAVLLFYPFYGSLGEWDVAAATALFTSISAFCNAGFSLWSDSLTAFRGDLLVMTTIMGLITVGGLGFVVVAALVDRENFRRSPEATWGRMSVHVKIVLLVSLGLVVFGAIVYYFLEFHESLAGLSRGEKLLASLFQSVTMRTAGFNTVDLGILSRTTAIFMILLMFVGGSSGSTAGGVKTSTLAVVFLSVRAMLLGRDDVEAAGRTIPKSIVYKSIAILVIFAALFVAGLIALLASEPDQPFTAILFETMSALATVGVSQGLTPELSDAGKVIVIFLMFVGRIGPLTLAFAVGERGRRVSLRYPEGKIVVG